MVIQDFDLGVVQVIEVILDYIQLTEVTRYRCKPNENLNSRGKE